MSHWLSWFQVYPEPMKSFRCFCHCAKAHPCVIIWVIINHINYKFCSQLTTCLHWSECERWGQLKRVHMTKLCVIPIASSEVHRTPLHSRVCQKDSHSLLKLLQPSLCFIMGKEYENEMSQKQECIRRSAYYTYLVGERSKVESEHIAGLDVLQYRKCDQLGMITWT